MSADNTDTEEQVSRVSTTLDDLEGLLEKQIEMVRRSDFRGVEELAERADSIMREITGTKVFERAEFSEQRERLTQLYRQLTLMVAAEEDQVGRQLRRVREGRRVLEAYRQGTAPGPQGTEA